MPASDALTYGMVGGGPGAFIGKVHRKALALDGTARLAAGAFSSDPAASSAHGAALGLEAARVYGSFAEMAEQEAARPPEERLDFVVVVVPNHLHAPVARAFLEQDFAVVCDKPLAATLAEAEALDRLAAERAGFLAVTYNYSGYPMVRQARALVREGALGEVRRVQADYVQGWLAQPADAGGKQAAWRTDPQKAGAGALADIGTHAEHLLRYVTGLRPQALLADARTAVAGRRLEDDASVLLRYAGGARASLTVTQVAAGEENDLRLRVMGSEGSLEWHQQEPTRLHVRRAARPERVYRPGNAYLAAAARPDERVPAGHPEAFIEAFANVYRAIARALRAHRRGEATDARFPTAADGARGLHFVERALESTARDAWVDARYVPASEREDDGA